VTSWKKKNVSQPSTNAYRWLVIALFWFAYFLNQADRQVLFSVFPLIQTEFGLDNTKLGLMGSVFFWVYAVMVPIAGSLGDALSRKKIIVFALLVWSASTFGSGLVTGFALLVAMRAVTGFGEAFYYPSATSIITDYHDQRTRATAMSVHQTAVYVGIVASGAIAGWIGQRFGWRPAFLSFGGIGLLFAFVLYAWLREPQRGQTEAVATSSLNLLERIIESFRRPSAIALAFAFLGMNFVNAAFQTWTPTWLYRKFGFTLAEAGFHATFYHYVGAFLGVLLGGKLADAYSMRSRLSRPLIQAVGLLCGAPIIWLLYRADSRGFVFVALGLFGFFRGLYDSNLFASLYEVVRPEARATATGLMLCVAFFGGGSSSVIVGWLSQRAGLGEALALTSLAYVLAGAALLLMCRVWFLRDAASMRANGTVPGAVATG
jgi:predicted MFS family arabinose efflux permease